jgi:hypothetical protein
MKPLEHQNFKDFFFSLQHQEAFEELFSNSSLFLSLRNIHFLLLAA